MMRSKDRFYWSDALYLARSKDALKKIGEEDGILIYRCETCSAFVKFAPDQGGGHWLRIKPYEQFRLEKQFLTNHPDGRGMREVVLRIKSKKLFRCTKCNLHWWRGSDGWSPADPEEIEHRLQKGSANGD